MTHINEFQLCNSQDLFTATPEEVAHNQPMLTFNGCPPEVVEDDENYDQEFDDYYDFSSDNYNDDYDDAPSPPQPQKWCTYKNKEIDVSRLCSIDF